MSLLSSLGAHRQRTELWIVKLSNDHLTCICLPKKRISKPVALKLYPFALKGRGSGLQSSSALGQLFNISFVVLRSYCPLVPLTSATQQARAVLLPWIATGTKKGPPSRKEACKLCIDMEDFSFNPLQEFKKLTLKAQIYFLAPLTFLGG